jgi:hypothetical protein
MKSYIAIAAMAAAAASFTPSAEAAGTITIDPTSDGSLYTCAGCNTVADGAYAFNLRSSGTDVFSSLEYNYGHAAQLLVSSVPEPSQPAMLAAGLLAMGLLLRRRNR